MIFVRKSKNNMKHSRLVVGGLLVLGVLYFCFSNYYAVSNRVVVRPSGETIKSEYAVSNRVVQPSGETAKSERTTAIVSLHDKNSISRGLTCWRNRTITREMAPHRLLVTGCGYSSTGFIAKALTRAGYDIGHEKMGADGSSAWPAATRGYIWAPSTFQHIIAIVRHPLYVIRSYNSTRWGFILGSVDVRTDVSIQPKEAFNAMQWEFQALEWWNTYTSQAEDLAECSYRIEDMNADLLSDICLKADFSNCKDKDWAAIITELGNYNSHVGRKKVEVVPWSYLEGIVVNNNEQMVLNHARLICDHFHYLNC